MNLSKNHQFQIAITPTNGAAATTDINGTTADCQSAKGVGMFVQMGAITATAVTSIKAQGSDDGSSWLDLEGTAQSIADTDDEKLFYIDLYRPLHRYNRVVVDRGTANAVVAAAWYEFYELREKNPTHGTGISGELHASPVAGTA
jgi:hypothetical protein